MAQVTWQKPEVWVHKGYKCYMYQSDHEENWWRCLEMVRPDGSQVNDPLIQTTKTNQTAYNIARNRKNVQRWLEEKIDWDMLSNEEKEARKSFQGFLF